MELNTYLNTMTDSIPKYKGRYFQRDKKILNQKKHFKYKAKYISIK